MFPSNASSVHFSAGSFFKYGRTTKIHVSFLDRFTDIENWRSSGIQIRIQTMQMKPTGSSRKYPKLTKFYQMVSHIFNNVPDGLSNFEYVYSPALVLMIEVDRRRS